MGDSGLVVVLFAQYTPAERKFIRAHFNLALKERNVIITKPHWDQAHSDELIVSYHGDVSEDFIKRLPPESIFRKVVEYTKRADDLSTKDALEAATDLIERASRANSKIGGPVNAVLLGSGRRPIQMTERKKN